MDFLKLAERLIPKIDWLLFIPVGFVLLILFLLFRGRFQRDPDLLKYSRYVYFLLFYVIAAIGFIILNALDILFHRANRFIVPPYLLIIPYALISGMVGALIGYILYRSASKVAPRAVYPMINAGIFLIALPAIWLLIIQPFCNSVYYVDPYGVHFNKTGVKSNHCALIKKDVDEDISLKDLRFTECLPGETNQEFEVLTDGSDQLYVNKKGSAATGIRKIPYGNIHETRNCLLEHGDKKYLVVLSILEPLKSGYSVLHVFDTNARCVYEEVFDDFIWGLLNYKNNRIIVSKQKMDENGFFEKKWFAYRFE